VTGQERHSVLAEYIASGSAEKNKSGSAIDPHEASDMKFADGIEEPFLAPYPARTAEMMYGRLAIYLDQPSISAVSAGVFRRFMIRLYIV
jgi:hypothetical protein